MKLLLDEHYSPKIAVQLRSAGYDAVTVAELGAGGADDAPLLELALAEERVLVTNNARDFVPLVRHWSAAGLDHCGVLLTSDESMPRSKGGIGAFVKTLTAVLDANAGTRALANQVRWLP